MHILNFIDQIWEEMEIRRLEAIPYNNKIVKNKLQYKMLLANIRDKL